MYNKKCKVSALCNARFYTSVRIMLISNNGPCKVTVYREESVCDQIKMLTVFVFDRSQWHHVRAAGVPQVS